MVAATLVDADIQMGRELVQILDQAGFPVTGAAWMYFPDVEEWRLVIRTPEAATNLQNAYLKMSAAMDAKGDLRQRIDLTRIKVVPPSDRVLEAIGKSIRVDGLGSVRFARNVIDGILIDDALIYRLAA
jgi:hypothetical protein